MILLYISEQLVYNYACREWSTKICMFNSTGSPCGSVINSYYIDIDGIITLVKPLYGIHMVSIYEVYNICRIRHLPIIYKSTCKTMHSIKIHWEATTQNGGMVGDIVRSWMFVTSDEFLRQIHASEQIIHILFCIFCIFMFSKSLTADKEMWLRNPSLKIKNRLVLYTFAALYTMF